MSKPRELEHAQLVLSLCDRFHCLPSQLMREDVEVLKLLQVEALGREEVSYE